MSMEAVQQALLKQFIDTFAGPYAGRISYENLVFQPPVAQPWLAVHFMPADEHVASLGPEGYDEANGLLQVTCYFTKGTGEKGVRETINQLRTCFKPARLVYDEQPVTILSRSRSNGGDRDGFYAVPFTVRWKALLSRT